MKTAPIFLSQKYDKWTTREDGRSLLCDWAAATFSWYELAAEATFRTLVHIAENVAQMIKKRIDQS